MKDKTITITARVSVKALAILTDYFITQGVKTMGATVRNALELLADHIQKECPSSFKTDEEAMMFLQSFGCKVGQVGERKNLPGNLDITFSGNTRTNLKESILAGIRLAKECKQHEEEGE